MTPGISGQVFPEVDHEPQGMATEYLDADAILHDVMAYCIDEMPLQVYSDTLRTVATPISGDAIARWKQVEREERDRA